MNFDIRRLGLISSVLLLGAFSSFGQSTSGNLTGTIFDPAGAAVPDAKVTAKNEATGQESSANASSGGNYRFENLPVGRYDLTVSATGFAGASLNGVAVQLNVTSTANLNLAVGSTSTTVEVSTAGAAIDTTTAQIQQTFEAKQLSDLPLTSSSGGQGVLNASLLNAGVATSGSVGAGVGPSVGGQRPRNNNFTIEGIDNNSVSTTGPLAQVPNDAVAEFSVLQNQFSADFGHSSGGQFNIVVKGGTNEFHGMAYEYFENRNLNAADNLYAVTDTPLHPRYDNNRFGGNFGGPIKRNKLFFFGEYEFNPIGQAGSAGLLYAPTAAGYNTIAANPNVNQNNLAILRQYLGTAAAPAVGGPSAVLANANAAALYTIPGQATTPIQVGQVPVSTPNYANYEEAVASVDYNLSDKDSMRGRFILNRTGLVDTAAQLPAFYQNIPSNYYIATFSEYHNFTPNLINELRIGYNRLSQNYPVGNQSFPGLDSFPNLVLNDLNVQLGPNPNAPQFGYQNNYQVTDNVTWTKGAHTIRVGFDGIRTIAPQAFTQRLRGDYEYNSISDYLLDFTPDYIAQRSQGNPIYWGNRWLLGGYANDIWKATPNVTINLGVRYENQTVPNGEQLQSLNAISSVPGLINFSTPKAQNNAVMPRVGIAYSPGTSGKTSIRAGFGLNYDILFDNFGLLTLPPQLSTTQDLTALGAPGFLANGGLLPTTASTATLSQADARAATAGFVPNQKRPESIQWNFGIEQQFATDYVFESRYLGTRGVFLPVQAQLNRVPIVTAANALPVYLSQPSQATLNGLTSTLDTLTTADTNGAYQPAAYANAGFVNPITSYSPIGNSTYHGWANQLSRRFTNGLQLVGAYTWSHNIDDSTAEVFSTVLTPRRPQDSSNLRPDRASSALDHRNRISLEAVYDLPFFKHSSRNWVMKNLIGNWEVAPVYVYQTGTLYTVQSAQDSNFNGDSTGDRAIVNPGGVEGTGSGTTALTNTAGQTVAYLATNPTAQFIATPLGALGTAGRNTSHLRPINNVDLAVTKRVTFYDRYSVEFSARATNIFNHAQYVGGAINDVGVPTDVANQIVSSQAVSLTTPGDPLFNDPTQVFSSNPRSMQLTLKFLF